MLEFFELQKQNSSPKSKLFEYFHIQFKESMDIKLSFVLVDPMMGFFVRLPI